MRVVTHLLIAAMALQNSARAGPIASEPLSTANSELSPSSWADLSKAVASAKNNSVYALNPATFTGNYTGPAIQLINKTITIKGNGIVLDAKGSGYFFDLADAATLILLYFTLCGGRNSNVSGNAWRCYFSFELVLCVFCVWAWDLIV